MSVIGVAYVHRSADTNLVAYRTTRNTQHTDTYAMALLVQGRVCTGMDVSCASLATAMSTSPSARTNSSWYHTTPHHTAAAESHQLLCLCTSAGVSKRASMRDRLLATADNSHCTHRQDRHMGPPHGRRAIRPHSHLYISSAVQQLLRRPRGISRPLLAPTNPRTAHMKGAPRAHARRLQVAGVARA